MNGIVLSVITLMIVRFTIVPVILSLCLALAYSPTLFVNLVIIYWFLLICCAHAIQKDATDTLTSIVYVGASFMAGVAASVVTARATIEIPNLFSVYTWALAGACVLFIGRRLSKRVVHAITALSCIAAFVSGTEFNIVLLNQLPLLESGTQIAIRYLFTHCVCIASLPDEGPKPPRKKEPKAVHDKRWVWLPRPRPSA